MRGWAGAVIGFRVTTGRDAVSTRRLLVFSLLLCAVIGGMAFIVWEVNSAWRFDAALKSARQLMSLNRFAAARSKLVNLPPRWSSDPEALYRLGACEHATGNIRSALKIWARAPIASDWGARAALARARTLVGDLGRFSEGEAVLDALLREPGPHREEARHTLAELYFWEGRRDEMRRLIEENIATSSDPAGELQNHWRLDNAVTLHETIDAEVERAAQLAKDDDRVWLAQANIALDTGKFESADACLKKCLSARPNDPSVWRARLNHALAVENLDAAREALAHLPTDRFTQSEFHEIRVWFASHLGNRPTEEQALVQLADAVWDNTGALERLATLEWEAGRHEAAREYRIRKAKRDQAKDRYRSLMDGKITPDRFLELAQLARTLGRRFEARGWWTLRAWQAPADDAARQNISALDTSLDDREPAKGKKLAELLADLDPKLHLAASRPKANTGDHHTVIPQFQDDAEAAGLRFVFDNGRTPQRQMPETSAGGIGILDYDGDGWMDIFAIQGGAFPPGPARRHGGDRLFRNRHDGTFEDATERSGIHRMAQGYGHGVTVGDYDNDGYPDLFVTRWRSYALYHNRGDGTFADVTAEMGLAGNRDWPTSAAFADLDSDGDLDLYVCHYLVWDPDHPRLCNRQTFATEQERVAPRQKFNYCPPRLFAASPDHLFRNDGGRFVDVTQESGIIDKDGRGLGVVAADIDDDGKVDLFVANDTTANYLWHNLGGMKFEETGLSSGVACNGGGAFQAGMGTACGDLDHDGLPDLLVTNFYGESTTFFRNLGDGMFNDVTAPSGLAAPSRFLLGFGIALFDANNDGLLDLATANGHVNDDRPDYPYEMPALLMIGIGDGRLKDVSKDAGPAWVVPRVARGLAVGDLDNDGRVDAVVLSQNSPVVYLHNQTRRRHFVTLVLEGVQSNRDGVGAVLTVRCGRREQRAWRYGGGSYQSASDPRVHFGLGDEIKIDELQVRWPSGHVDRFGDIVVDRIYRLSEGATAPAATGTERVRSE
jgi:tetratricopeptide (TPR) repeat protein